MKKSKNDAVIVTRHMGAVEWLKSRGIVAPVLRHATEADIAGKRVYGVIPLYLASKAKEVSAIDMPNMMISQRGKEMTVEEMNKAGAHLVKYKVVKLE